MKMITAVIFLVLYSFTLKAADMSSAAERLHQQACSITPYASDNPWHIANLYDCTTRELFIPYQLWSGAKWNGDKQASCMHAIDRQSIFSKPPGSPSNQYVSGPVTIKGPILWNDPHTGETLEVWERTRPSRNTGKYYACHSRGIGDVYNIAKPYDHYVRGLCRAPGGFGWKIGQRRTCIKTTIEIDDLTLDGNNLLEHLYVKYWFRDKLKYRYLYKPNQGATEIFRYKK